MACGHLPFTGDSMAQLMFKIANEPHTDILTYNPKLPESVVAVINMALAKEPEKRYQTGDEMAQAIRACIATLGAAPAGPASVDVSL